MANKLPNSLKRKQLARIRGILDRAEKRGYKYSKSFRTNIRNLSLAELKDYTAQVLYEEILTYELEGEIVAGSVQRKIERSEAGRLASWTRKHSGFITGDASEYIPQFTDIVLRNIEEMIAEAHRAGWEQIKRNANWLEDALNKEIETYGRDKVAVSCENAPDQTKAEAVTALYASTDGECHFHTTAMIMLIRSHIPTIKESKEYTEAMEWLEQNYTEV